MESDIPIGPHQIEARLVGAIAQVKATLTIKEHRASGVHLLQQIFRGQYQVNGDLPLMPGSHHFAQGFKFSDLTRSRLSARKQQERMPGIAQYLEQPHRFAGPLGNPSIGGPVAGHWTGAVEARETMGMLLDDWTIPVANSQLGESLSKAVFEARQASNQVEGQVAYLLGHTIMEHGYSRELIR